VNADVRRSAALDRESKRSLSAEDAHEYLAAPVSDLEREEVLALVDWFNRRYPTPLARLAYARTAYARWCQASGSPPR